MKKNVIALAVAAAMAAPLAQAEVTVSGSLQAELQSVSNDFAGTSGAAEGLYLDKGGRGKIDFMASEDLGNGMKAIAKFGMNAGTADNYTSTLTGRDAYVGLSGGFGTVLAGSMSNPYKSSTVSWDPFLETSAQARGNGGMTGWHSGYTNNAIAYANKFGMAKVVAAIVVDEAVDGGTTPANTDTTGNHGSSIAVNVPVGPVELALAYINVDDMGADTGDTADMNSAKLGVKYTAGPMSVAIQYEDGEDITNAGVQQDVTAMYINGTYTMGANKFAIAYGQTDLDPDGANSDTELTYTALGVSHSFSKQTNVYVNYRNTDKDAPGTGAADGDTSVFAVGMRVNF